MRARSSQSKFNWGTAGLVLGIVLITPLLAAVNAVVGPYAVLPYVGLAALLVFFVLPLDLLVLLALFASSVVIGLLDYFAGISQAFWLPYLMGLLFAMRALVERLKPEHRPAGLRLPGPALQSLPQLRSGAVQGPRVLTLLALGYLLTGVFSTLIALPSFGQVFVAAKNYWFMWGVLLVLLWCPLPERVSQRFWTLLIIVGCLQWPVAAYQRFFIASKRTDAAAWDAVVGTFGGNPQTGGHSAAMALVLCLGVGTLIWRMREKRLSPLWGWLLVLTCIAPIALAEVKAAFIWLALVFLLLFARQVARQPFRATLTLILGAVLLTGVGWVYKTAFYESQGSQTFEQIYEKQLKYAFDPNDYRAEFGRLGRVASLGFWWQKHEAASDPLHFFLGHGLGASRGASALGMGDEARKYSVALDTTGASTLLWDVGLIGTAAFVGLLAVGGVFGVRLSRDERFSAGRRETLFLSGTVLVLSTLGVFYNRDAIDTPVVQLLVYFSLGQIALAKRALSGMPLAQLTKPTVAPSISKASSGPLSA